MFFIVKFITTQSSSSSFEIQETKEFAEWILQVGDGIAGEPNDGEVDIKIPKDLLLREVNHPISTIVDSTYPSLLEHLVDPSLDPEYFIIGLSLYLQMK